MLTQGAQDVGILEAGGKAFRILAGLVRIQHGFLILAVLRGGFVQFLGGKGCFSRCHPGLFDIRCQSLNPLFGCQPDLRVFAFGSLLGLFLGLPRL